MRIIKKYKNRRLYDTDTNVYITLDDVKELIYQNIEFKVIDAATEKDLTQTTLLQIITEQETTSNPIFSNEMLCNFIRSYQEKSQNIFRKYLEQTMHIFMQQNDFLIRQLENYQSAISSLSRKNDTPPKSSDNKSKNK